MHLRLFRNVAAALAGALLLVSAPSFPAGQESTEPATLETVKQEVAEATRAIKNYSADQRDEALRAARAALEKFDARAERMQARLDERWEEMDRSGRKNAREMLKSLRQRRNELAEWYGGLKHSSAQAWEEVKAGFLDSYESLSEAFGEAYEAF